jgi:hypothetical protein
LCWRRLVEILHFNGNEPRCDSSAAADQQTQGTCGSDSRRRTKSGGRTYPENDRERTGNEQYSNHTTGGRDNGN